MAKAKAAKAKPNPRNKKLYDDGMKVRKAVLGADYVDNSMAGADDFMMSFQDITTEYAWGYVWTRPGLPKKTRSMLNLAMLAALNRAPELKLHVNGALNNGLTKEEIKEVFLQVAIYCGIPASLDAFKTAREVFKERGVQGCRPERSEGPHRRLPPDLRLPGHEILRCAQDDKWWGDGVHSIRTDRRRRESQRAVRAVEGALAL
jgi:4-carboxymuconolactone decarboxylase